MTEFSEIYERFLKRVEIYSFLNLKIELRERILRSYLDDALARFDGYCKEDLYDINEDKKCFNYKLNKKAIYLIAENMVVVWLKRERDREENTKNCMSEKDYSIFSPANLLNTLNNTYKDANSEVYADMNEYSLSEFDPMDLIKGENR
ncbi:hypothetical protein CWE04_11805 [Thomasclavelia cocleata]|uniref:Uncharacterized protein n=1 Tax=Thomasclavelia cocleata TaxID=69824 RepID=A0A1I0BJJ5_9FIRM|nr:hypothetical protein [Thomasclavelia cocleata]MCR1960212.1 hypothetical protein [Thomasclavelia cocleata]NDO41814.1 hypothetical protein [Thomasclavelia cocleata]PJN79887.1 hypothetical protein CWE04_11805 [Thomasclavelia cocleata]SET07177.1 hypothetical protein SAMN04489758_101153 [Thomasclavelia cocleata]